MNGEPRWFAVAFLAVTAWVCLGLFAEFEEWEFLAAAVSALGFWLAFLLIRDGE